MHHKGLWYIVVALILLSAAIYLLIQYSATKVHEQAHQQIERYFGCQNSTIYMSFFGTSYAQCLDANRSVTQEEWALHSLNEIVSYNDSTISNTIFFCTILLMVFFYSLFYYAQRE